MIAPPSNSIPTARRSDETDDSDSDWEDDDDFVAKKINIKIKPVAQLTPSKISASVDELRATVGTWKSMANVNLVKPNSRRSLHQSTMQLNRTSILGENNNILPAMPPPPLPMQLADMTRLNSTVPLLSNSSRPTLPVAFATQECLHVRTLMSSDGESDTSLIGHIKMAVPRRIIEFNGSDFENNDLVIDIESPEAWSTCSVNQQFVRGDADYPKPVQMINELQTFKETKRLFIDMGLVYSYARQSFQRQKESKYFLLPELLSYTLRSHDVIDSDENNQFGRSEISPIRAVAHWLCDLEVTKLRIDLDFLQDSLGAPRLKPHDIENVKLSLQVNGNVLSQQSKPAATWSPISSRLTWSFANLGEIIETSTVNGVTSCLAKMSLGDGPSTPSDISLQFSINGKTISGTTLTLPDASAGYKIAKHKCEVKTGTFKCEPPCF